ncbi:LapA family protein [Streptococcus suis]|nr:LapA family protein [Streptococcus suis]
MKKKLSLIGLLVIIVLTVVLSLANQQVVKVNYIFGYFRMPLILVILGSVFLGLVIQYLLGMAKNMGLKSEIKSLKKQAREQAELEEGRLAQAADKSLEG